VCVWKEPSIDELRVTHKPSRLVPKAGSAYSETNEQIT
jgi:hypothetical protein